MQGKKVLLISTQLPFPPKSGGTVKTWNFVQHLAKNNSLSLACLLKEDDALHEEEMHEKLSLTHYVSEEVIVPRNFTNLLRSYFQAPCLNAYRNDSQIFRSKLAPLLEDCEVLIIDHYEMFQYLPKNYQGKVILHTHNAEFMLWQRMAELERNWLIKLALKIEAFRVKNYERSLFQKADLVFSTPADIQLYQKAGLPVKNHRPTYHLGNDSLLSLANLEFAQTEKALCFIGTLSWEPNIDGLDWFIQKVWPKIKSKEPSVKLYVLGKNPDDRLVSSANKDKNIHFVGFVKDLDAYLKKTRVYLAPLRFGSGMKVKVLEGLYRGVPSVITSVAAEGLAIQSGKHALLSDEAESYAAYCLQLLSDQKKWESMRDEARSLAKSRYLWKDLFQQMDAEMSPLFHS